MAVGPEVTATLDERDPESPLLELENSSSAPALDVRFRLAGRPERLVGDLAPGATTRVPVKPVPYGPVDCVWTCVDEDGRTHRWSYR